MVVSPIFRALSTLTSSGDILPFTMFRRPTSGCYALSTGFIDSSDLFLGFPRSFASDDASHHFLFVDVCRRHLVVGHFSDTAANVQAQILGFNRFGFECDAD